MNGFKFNEYSTLGSSTTALIDFNAARLIILSWMLLVEVTSLISRPGPRPVTSIYEDDISTMYTRIQSPRLFLSICWHASEPSNKGLTYTECLNILLVNWFSSPNRRPRGIKRLEKNIVIRISWEPRSLDSLEVTLSETCDTYGQGLTYITKRRVLPVDQKSNMTCGVSNPHPDSRNFTEITQIWLASLLGFRQSVYGEMGKLCSGDMGNVTKEQIRAEKVYIRNNSSIIFWNLSPWWKSTCLIRPYPKILLRPST